MGSVFGALLAVALLGAASLLGYLPEQLMGVARSLSLVIVFFGAAAPLLRILAPAEPALLKWVLFSCLLSPILMVGLWLLVRVITGGEPEWALAICFLAASCFQVLGMLCESRLQRREKDPIGRAPLAALAIAVSFAAAVALVVFGQEAIRVSFHGLLHTSIAEATLVSVPPENPWLAGSQLQYYWVWHAMASLVATSLWIAPTFAFAALNVWAAFCLPLALYFLGAPLWRCARRDLGGVVIALFGLNVLVGWAWLRNQAPFVPHENPLAILQANFGPLVGDGDLRLAWGPAKFFNVSSYPAALALLVGGWLAAAHALAPTKQGSAVSLRVWGLLAALCLGASFAVNPLVGAAGLGSTGLAFLLLRDFSRPKLHFLGMLALAAIPGALEVLGAASHREADSVALGFSTAALSRAFWPLVPLLILAALPLARPSVLQGEGSGARRAVLVLLGCGAGLSIVLAVCVRLPLDNQYKFVRTAQIPLGLLAAGGLGQLLTWDQRGRTAARSLGALLLIVLGVGAGAGSLLGARSYLAISAASLPLDEGADGVLPSGTGDTASAMAWLRAAAPALATGAGRGILLLNPPLEGSRGLAYGEHVFGSPANLQGHEAAAFSGLNLFVDRRFYLVDGDPRWAPRLGLVQAYFGGDPQAAELLKAELEALGRPVLVLRESGSPSSQADQSMGMEVLAELGSYQILGDDPARKLLGDSDGGMQE